MDTHKIESILEQTNIVDVIGSYIPLKRTGSNFKARCPFHDEKTASFVVSEKKQIYKCFGCGIAGNAITFIRDYEKISYIEAVKKLAEKLGISIDTHHQQKQENSKIEALKKVYNLTSKYFQQNLEDHGNIAKEYLKKRSISFEVIKQFEIGFSLPSYTGLINYLTKHDIDRKIVEESGLVSQTKKGQIDIFRNRIMFPIHSIRGGVVAFGGRIMESVPNVGKYINSPTTDIYTKGNELYGLHLTRYEISKKKHALICEGYLDFLRLYDQGFQHSVASLGTALTSKQINLLSRYTENFIMLYDGDKAGTKAALKAAGEVIKHGYSARIVALAENEDPDSFLLKNGVSALQELINKAEDFSHFLASNTSLQLSKKEKLNMILDIANDIQDEVARELFLNQNAEIHGISNHALTSKIKKKRVRGEKKIQLLHQYQEERYLISLLLKNASIHKKVAQNIQSDYFFSESYKKLFESVLYQIHEDMKESIILELIDDSELKKLVSELMWEELPPIAVDTVINGLKIRKIEVELQKLQELMVGKSNKRDLLLKKVKLKKELSRLRPGIRVKPIVRGE